MANYFGVTSTEAALANEFFAGYRGAPATMLISRYCLEGERPHLYGANISNLTLNQLQSISGSLSIAFQGCTYSGSINLSGQSFSGAAGAIQAALNSSLPVAAVTDGSSIAPLYAPILGTVSPETMTESYGVLTVGSVSSGTVGVGQQITGAGVASLTAIDGNLSGSGAGSTWLVNNAQTVAGENMTMTAPPLNVQYHSIVGATANRDYFDVQPNGDFGYDYNPGSLSYVGGTAAAALGLTQASGALDSTSSGFPTSAAAYMNNLVQNENSQFGSFQASGDPLEQLDPEYLGDLAAWAQSTDGLYQFLSQSTSSILFVTGRFRG